MVNDAADNLATVSVHAGAADPESITRPAVQPIYQTAVYDNAAEVASFLASHPRVQAVHYPGLPSHPDHALASRLLRRGYGGLLSFDLDDEAAAMAFLRRLRLITLSPSLGGVNTTILHPAKTSHPTLTPDDRALLGITDGMLRLSVGIERPADIIADLDTALEATE